MLNKRGGEFFVANCTKCGMDLDTGTMDFGTARQILKDAGWKTQPAAVGREWNHYCEDCA